LFCLILTFIFLNSCMTNQNPGLPEILTAETKIKTHSESERGYEVFLVINDFPETARIKGIVLKSSLFQPIRFTRMLENEIFIQQYLPVVSRKIANFRPPKTDSRPDGIIFEID